MKLASASHAAVLVAGLAFFSGGACRPAREPSAASTPGAATGPVDAQRPLPSPLPSIAATVDGQPVPIERVALAARPEQARAEDRSRPDPGALRRALQKLIVRELLFQEAVRRGVQADARTVERAFDAERARYGSETEWELFLRRGGLSADTYRAELRVQATVDAFLAQLAAEIDPEAIPESDLRAFYDEHPDLGASAQPPPFEVVAPQVREALAQSLATQKMDALLRELEAKARIDVRL